MKAQTVHESLHTCVTIRMKLQLLTLTPLCWTRVQMHYAMLTLENTFWEVHKGNTGEHVITIYRCEGYRVAIYGTKQKRL